MSDVGLRSLLGADASRAAPAAAPAALLTAAALQAVRDDAARVSVPPAVQALLAELRGWIQRDGAAYVSDRRMTKAVSLLKVAAHASGRAAVELHDCLLLEHVMWQRPEDAPALRQWLLVRALPQPGARDVDLSAGLDSAYREARAACGDAGQASHKH